jgi:hypothetical protein
MQGLTHVGDLVVRRKIFPLMSVALAIVLVYLQAASAFKKTATSNEDGFSRE